MKALLAFDLDGTLIDSATDIANAVNQTLMKYDKAPVEYATVVAHIGEGLRNLLAGFFPDYLSQPQKLAALEREFLDIYEEQMLHNTVLYPGVLDFLQCWQGPVGIITNKNIQPTKILVQHLGLNKIPWVEIYGADSLSEKKPSPLPLQNMMRLAQRPPEKTFMIGDGIPDMLSAKNAGVRSIAINFGYTHMDRLRIHAPTAELGHYSDLANLLSRLETT